MLYAEFLQKKVFSQQELLAFSWGRLIDDPPEKGILALPAPPMLMLTRVLNVEHNGARGCIVAEQDIHLDDWFFQCHFRNDPVQPGCLGVDAVWQLLGFYLSLRGAHGSGRALGCQEVDFFGQIRPHNKQVRYEVKVRRYTHLEDKGTSLVLGDAEVFVDDEMVYRIKQAKVGSFVDIAYTNYPHESEFARGGQMQSARSIETV